MLLQLTTLVGENYTAVERKKTGSGVEVLRLTSVKEEMAILYINQSDRCTSASTSFLVAKLQPV